MTRGDDYVVDAAEAASATALANGNLAEVRVAGADGNGSTPPALRRSSRVRRPPQPPFQPSFGDRPARSRPSSSHRSGRSGYGEGNASSEDDDAQASRLDQVTVSDGGSMRLTVHPCAAALMQFHAHLARTEVIGYVAGYSTDDHSCVHILEAFPAKAVSSSVLSRSGRSALREVEMEPESDVDVRIRVLSKGLNIVGWYHSHPDAGFTVEPSHVDIENQKNFQNFIMKGVPFVGAILAPYNSDLPDQRGDMAVFYAGDSQPMRIPYTVEYGHADGAQMAEYRMHLQGKVIPDEALEAEAVTLIEFYSNFRQRVHLSKEWRPDTTYLNKLRACLLALLPEIPKPGQVPAPLPSGLSPGAGPSSAPNGKMDAGNGHLGVNGKDSVESKLSLDEIEENQIMAAILESEEMARQAKIKKSEAMEIVEIEDNSTAGLTKVDSTGAQKKEDNEDEGSDEEPKIEILRPDCGDVKIGPVSIDTARVANEQLSALFSRLLGMASQTWLKPPEPKGKGSKGKKRRKRR